MGCGVVAMSDLELYFTQQNSGYKAPHQSINYNESDGLISKSDYMDYAEYNRDFVYKLLAHPVSYVGGVAPWDMENEMGYYLKENGYPYQSVNWEPTSNSNLLIQKIKAMIDNGIPVVFSYDDSEPLFMYGSIEQAKTASEEAFDNYCRSHYMTIIGYTKYLKEDGKTYGYILKIVSWGNIYYVNYDQYTKTWLDFTSNILEIK
ncbi:MAG: C39 family peptidase [Lachnospiraceae bacterium]|nr:C39 family peptidase [Lachnospiraceae bacterium]